MTNAVLQRFQFNSKGVPVNFNLVQPIIVSSKGSHEGTILSAVYACNAIFKTSYLSVSNPDPRWELWLSGSFTKHVRRANPHLLDKIRQRYLEFFIESNASPFMYDYNNAALAFSPFSYPFPKNDSFYKLISKTQVSGTDFFRLGWPAPPASGFVIAINPDIRMSTGKTAAQCCHASLAWQLKMKAIENNPNLLIRITDNLSVFNELRHSKDSILIHDAGLTEIPPNTLTTVAGYL